MNLKTDNIDNSIYNEKSCEFFKNSLRHFFSYLGLLRGSKHKYFYFCSKNTSLNTMKNIYIIINANNIINSNQMNNQKRSCKGIQASSSTIYSFSRVFICFLLLFFFAFFSAVVDWFAKWKSLIVWEKGGEGKLGIERDKTASRFCVRVREIASYLA